MEKLVLLTVTQSANALGISKQDMLKLVEEKNLTKYKAFPTDFRFELSMQEVNRLKSKGVEF